MRYPISYQVFMTADAAEVAREAEFRAMLRRPDAEPLPEEPERAGVLAWLAGLARRRPATRARRAAG